MKNITNTIIAALAFVQFASAEGSAATRMLKARSAHLEPMITKVSPSVYTASGYSPANISMLTTLNGAQSYAIAL